MQVIRCVIKHSTNINNIPLHLHSIVLFMNKNIKIGDLVESCSLMPGIVMSIRPDGDEILIRSLDVDEYRPNDFMHCSLSHCGIVKIDSYGALMRLMLGKEKLNNLWKNNDEYENYVKAIAKAYSLAVV